MLRKSAHEILAVGLREIIVADIGILVEEKGRHEHKTSIEVHDETPENDGHDLISSEYSYLLEQLEEYPLIVVLVLLLLLCNEELRCLLHQANQLILF